MSKPNNFFRFLRHFKYFLVIAVGALCIGFAGDSSILNLMRMDSRIAELRELLRAEQATNKAAKREMERIAANPAYIEHVAREKYMMKRDDEDIFVLRSQLSRQTNETAK